MSSFAVKKYGIYDRLISWPRLQNLLFLDAPDVDLPSPNLFGGLFHHPQSGFALDVSNMFHNMLLPRWLSDCLPLGSVAFGDLRRDAQQQAMQDLKLPRRPAQTTRLFPTRKPYGWPLTGAWR